MTREVTTRAVLDDDALALVLTPRDGFVLERAVGDGRFELVEGPFHHYEREVVALEVEGGTEVVQTVRWKVAMPATGWTLRPQIRREMAKLSDENESWPWWSPPERQSKRTSQLLGLLCGLALVLGYATSATTQTITFAIDEFGLSDAAQGNALAGIRIGVIASLGLLVLADRRGRRQLLLVTTLVACFATAVGAVSPNIYVLAGTQTITRGVATTASVLLLVVAAEEVGPRSRAFAISLLAMSGGVGGLFAVMLLPLAGIADWSWRLLFLVPLAFLPLWRAVARSLPESRRFEAALATTDDDDLRRQPEARRNFVRRLVLLSTAGYLGAMFAAPAHQLLNDFLKDERGFSAGDISGFRLATSLPGVFGIVIGGRLAETWGRRRVGATAVLGSALLGVAVYNSDGIAMWLAGMGFIIFSAATVPALGVYGPELFPTQLRARANAIITTISVMGSATGLVLAGQLDDRLDGAGTGIALLALGPVVVTVLVLTLYPETVDRELEDINPEDAALTARLDGFT